MEMEAHESKSAQGPWKPNVALPCWQNTSPLMHTEFLEVLETVLGSEVNTQLKVMFYQ